MTATNFNLSPDAVFRAFSTTGQPLAGGLLYTYAAGTLTPQATYTDSTGATPNTNPVVLDSTGSASVWLNRAAYKFVLKDANNVTQWTTDQINAQPVKIIDVADYGAVGDGATNDSPAFIAAAAAAGAWGTVLIKRPSVSYLLNSNITGPCFWTLMGGAATSGSGTLGGLTIQQVSGGALNVGNLYITSSGAVGIGTNAPIAQLDVAGSINIPYVGGNPIGKLEWNGGVDGSVDAGVTNANAVTVIDASAAQYTFNSGVFKAPSATVNSANPNFIVGNYAGYFQNSGSLLYGLGTAMVQGTIGLNNGTNGWVFGCNAFSGVSGRLELIRQSAVTFGSYIVELTVDAAHNWIWNSASPTGTYTFNGTGNTGVTMTLVDTAAAGLNANVYHILDFKRAGAVVGSITTTSAVTAYNTTSDYRLKENLASITGAVGVVEAVPMYQGNYKSVPDTLMNFALAHEVQEYLPYAVTGVKDGEEMQQVDYSKLVPVLWAAVQELAAKVRRLENGK